MQKIADQPWIALAFVLILAGLWLAAWRRIRRDRRHKPRIGVDRRNKGRVEHDRRWKNRN